EDGVAQPELGDAGVGERIAQPELVAQAVAHRVEVGGDEHRLAQPHIGHGRARYTREAVSTIAATSRPSWRAGLRAGLPYALAGFLLSLSFGVLAREAGLSAVAALALSAVVFAGAAPVAAVSVLPAGGGAR